MAGFEFTGDVRPAENVLASRYASREMKANFSDDYRIFAERGLWIEVMRAQADLGVAIPEEAIEDYVKVQGVIDRESIRRRELVLKHDVMARLTEFNELAGHQFGHEAMTSRDPTENIEQLQILRGLDIVHDRMVATLARFGSRSAEFATLPMAGRSHNVAGQPITLGKRFANWGEELLIAYENLCSLRESYPLRGIKGPMGTQQDMLDLFEGDANKVTELEKRIAAKLGFGAMLGSVGQVYPRSLDLSVVTALEQAAAGPSNLATMIRLMAGHELINEGFSKGQKGSSAMPHKMNSRTCERINGLKAILAGHASMASHLSGNQWLEGDVSCSVVRRVMIPDSFYAIDGLFQATLHVLDELGPYSTVIEQELQRYLPFLTTTKALTAAVKAGAGREDAHDIIQEHSVAVVTKMRQEGGVNDLFDRLGTDDRLPVSKEQLLEAVGKPLELIGLAVPQVEAFVGRIQKVVDKYPEAARYQPEPLL
ncbi:adenylosuccinate lyase [Candidatus Saccharibacteria bacterium]|nr:adenylosuccinate lyase [Candidatus Saccharibacteria bacterium]